MKARTGAVAETGTETDTEADTVTGADTVTDTATDPGSGLPPGRRFLPLSVFYRRRFGGSVHKVPLDAGLTCPNADGTKGVGGCTFCDNRSFSPARRQGLPTVREQIDLGIERTELRYGERRFLAYFQAATNTYGPVDLLRDLWEQALDHPRIEGLVIGTRPDCLPEEVLDLLEEIAGRTHVSLEIGLQSLSDAVLRWTRRGHDAASFFDAVERARGRGIELVVHVILGFPGETRDDARRLGEVLGPMGIDGIKIHALHVVRETPLELLFREGRLALISLEEHAARAADILESLPTTVAIHRLSADAPGRWLVAPSWCRDKHRVVRAVEAELEARGSWQGQRARG
jgi:hypothetical protein